MNEFDLPKDAQVLSSENEARAHAQVFCDEMGGPLGIQYIIYPVEGGGFSPIFFGKLCQVRHVREELELNKWTILD